MKKLLLLIVILLSVFSLQAQVVKPDYIRTPNGPNTIVDWNLKAKTFILPSYALYGRPVSQDSPGQIFLNSDTTDKHIYVRQVNGYYLGLANIKDLNLSNSIQYTPSETAAANYNNGKYNAFGQISIFPNGEYIMTYRQSDDHIGSVGNTPLKMQKSVTGGKTWSTPVTIVSDATYLLGGAVGGVIPSGRFMLFNSRATSSTFPFEIQYRYSDDNGTTYSTPQLLNIGSETNVEAFNASIAIDSGKVAQGWYSLNSGTNGSIWLAISANNGATYTSKRVIQSDAGHIYSEGAFTHLGGGVIACVARNESYLQSRLIISFDNGNTWVDKGDCPWGTIPSPVALSTYKGLNGRRVVECIYRDYVGSYPLKTVAIYANAQDLELYGNLAWQLESKATIDTTGKYPNVIHPYDSPYGVGWYYVDSASYPALSGTYTTIRHFNVPIDNSIASRALFAANVTVRDTLDASVLVNAQGNIKTQLDTKELLSNKVTTLSGANNNTYPTTLTVFNAIAASPAGTVISVTPGYGHTSTTPITSTGTITIDSAVIKTKESALVDYNILMSGKQNTLVSGTNIKTVGSTSILGSGDIPFPTSLPTTNPITFNNSGSGEASGTTFDGNAARTVSYNTIGAQPAGSYLVAGNNLSDVTNASTARSSLGLAIGSDVLAYRTFGTAANNNTGDFEAPLTIDYGLSRAGNTVKADSAVLKTKASALADYNVLMTGLGTKQNALSGTGFVKISGTTISYDNNTYYKSGDDITVKDITQLSTGAARVVSPITGTNPIVDVFTNTGGSRRSGIESSAGNNQFTGGAAYAMVDGTDGATVVQRGTNGVIRETLGTTGLFRWHAYGDGVLQTDASGNVTANTALANGTTATTQSAGTNDNTVATTAYVDAAVAGSLTSATVNAQTTGQTIITHAVGGADKVFDVSGFATISSASTLSFNLNVTFTDENNTSTSYNLLVGVFANGQYGSEAHTIKAKSGTNIVISTNLTGSCTYNAGAYIRPLF